jgi:hypothetical protein
MLIKYFAPYLAVAVTLIVWSLNQRENRKLEIFKWRSQRRLDMFESLILDISNFVDSLYKYNGDNSNYEYINNVNCSANNLSKYRIKMKCFGRNDERDLFESYIEAINSKNIDSLKLINDKLVNLITKNIRRELEVTD